MRTALAFHTLMAGRSKRVLPMTAPDAFFAGLCAQSAASGALSFSPLAASACNASPRCSALNPAIAESHAEKSSAFIESIPAIRPNLTQTNS